MALPVSGKTYCFKCVGATNRYLNLYSSGTASNGMNVVLYTSDSSNEQKWKYSGSKLLSVTNTGFALDKYTLAGNANNNNADIWTANDPANQNITFVAVSGNTVRIKLAGSAHYLTAYSNANGTGTGKTPTSAGNVYWASSSTSAMQQWTFEEVTGGGGGTEPVLGQRGNLTGTSYRSTNPLYPTYEGQCTWYCLGRAHERTGRMPPYINSAGSWVPNISASGTPVANCVAVFTGSGQYSNGHVVYIEKVLTTGSNPTIWISEANYSPWDDALDPTDGIVRETTLDALKSRGTAYTLKGYYRV